MLLVDLYLFVVSSLDLRKKTTKLHPMQKCKKTAISQGFFWVFMLRIQLQEKSKGYFSRGTQAAIVSVFMEKESSTSG